MFIATNIQVKHSIHQPKVQCPEMIAILTMTILNSMIKKINTVMLNFN